MGAPAPPAGPNVAFAEVRWHVHRLQSCRHCRFAHPRDGEPGGLRLCLRQPTAGRIVFDGAAPCADFVALTQTED